MQPELLIGLVAAALVLGFICGYLVRAMVSWRRRRRAGRRLAGHTDQDLGFRLEKLAGAGREEMLETSLTAATDAPALAELDVAARLRSAKQDPLGRAGQRRANGTARKH